MCIIDKNVKLLKKMSEQDDYMYIAIDFDGIIHKIDPDKYDGYTHFDELIQNAAYYMGKLKEQGWKIIIWTVRQNSLELQKYLDDNQIPYDTINTNACIMWPGMSQKVYADVYVDDRNYDIIGEEFDWALAYNIITAKFKKYYKMVDGKLTIRRSYGE